MFQFLGSLSSSVVIRDEESVTESRPRRGRRCLRSVVLLSCGLVVLLSTFYFLRSPILAGLARIWIVNDPLEKADAIVLLGGGLETRPFVAAKLYHAGYAPRILIARVKASPTDDLGLTTREQDTTRQILIKQGVPDAAIDEFGNDVQNTHDEAFGLRAWAATNYRARVIIPTDLFHTRRVRWLFRKQLKSMGTSVLVQAVPAREYTAADWWRNEHGLVAFQNEVLKFAYYWVKY